MNDDDDYPREWKAQFRLRRSSVSADAKLVDGCEHGNVLLLTLHRTAFQALLLAIIGWLPLLIQTFAKTHWPGLFLPAQVVLKKMRPGRDEEFEHEKYVYGLLSELQGRQVPVCYGEAEYDGTRALVLSYIRGGVTAFHLEGVEPDEYGRMIEEAILPMQRYLAVPDDARLNNFLVVGGRRIVVVDLEHVQICDSPDSAQWCAGSVVDQLVMLYGGSLRARKGLYSERKNMDPRFSLPPVFPRYLHAGGQGD